MFSIKRRKESRRRHALRQAIEALEGRVLLAYTLDPSFGGDGIVDGLGTDGFAVQSDNKVVAISNTSGSPGISRVNVNGSLDTSFGAGGKVVTPFAVRDVVISGGKIIVAGGNFQVARYNANGTLDTTFGGGDGISQATTQHGRDVSDLALAPDGKLVIVGAGSESPDPNDISQDRAYDIVARFNADGAVDTSFSGDGVYEEMVPDQHYGGLLLGGVQSNGKIVVIGNSVFSPMDGAHLYMWRLNTDGTTDSSFNQSGWINVAIGDLDIAPDDKIVVAVEAHIERFNANGTVDSGFSTNGYGLADFEDAIHGVQPLAGGGTLVSGFVQGGGFVGRLLPNGNPDAAFAPGGKTGVGDRVLPQDVRTDSANRVVIGGQYSLASGFTPLVGRLADVPQTPFKGSAFQVGQVIQAEDFDLGGEGVAYHDTDARNIGAYYRTNEGVDIERTGDVGGGYNVGWANAGEWMEYTINVAAGAYTIDTRVASPKSGGGFHYEIDGQRAGSDVAIPNTGAYQTYRTVTSALGDISAGTHVLRLVVNPSPLSGAVANFNWMMIKSTTGGGGGGGGSGTGLKGEYFNNMDFTAPVLTRNDANINFNWGTGSPDPRIDPDTFSVRWSGQVQAPATGRYTFYTTTDDGVRLTVNGQRLIDKLVPQAATEWSGSIDLVAGQKYDIVMDYFERAGGAQAKLSWSGPGIAKQVIPASAFGTTGGSSDTQAPTAVSELRATRIASNEIDIQWNGARDNVGLAGYELRIGDNAPIVLSSGALSYTANNLQPNTPYRFQLTAFDAAGNHGPTSTIQVTTSSVDSQAPSAVPNFRAIRVTDQDIEVAWDAASDNSGVHHYELFPDRQSDPLIIRAGDPRNWLFGNYDGGSTHTYTIRAVDAEGNAGPSTTITVTTKGGTIGDGNGLSGEYFNNSDFTAPVLTRTDASVNFDWGTGSPDARIEPDTFSVRWSGWVQTINTGNYLFHTTTDDGVRLWVNGQRVIDQFVPQAATEHTGGIQLVGDQKYEIRMEYFERSGGAKAQLRWTPPGGQKQIIPQSQLYSGLPADTTPPSAIPYLAARRIHSQGIDIVWEHATDNMAVTGYVLQLDDGPKSTVDELRRFWTWGNLQPGTSHVVKVSAFDAAGNVGPVATLPFTTTA